MARRSNNNNKNTSRQKWKLYLITALVLIFFLSVGTVLGGLYFIVSETPDISDYRGGRQSTMIYSGDGTLINSLYQENRVYVTLDDIPEELQQAIVAIEDHNFYDHHGVDLVGISRALITNIAEGRIVQGASTITQQLAREALLSQEKTFFRKLQEVYLALQFERLYTKSEILEMYLNEIFFGHSAYGVEAASRQYFGRSVSELDLSESALIAALPRSPNYYSPFNNEDAARSRRNVVLNRMQQLGYINENEFEMARTAEIELHPAGRQQVDESAPYFVRYVRDQLLRMFGAQEVYGGGLEVYTTIDLDKQKKAEEAFQQALQEGIIPSHERDGEIANIQPQYASISLDPRTGEIKSMIGGRGDDQFNRATQAARQPGSAFKPFVYTRAIEEGFYPASIISDIPRPAFRSDTTYEIWPVNFGHEYHGMVSLRQALASSLNVAAVNMIEKVGVKDTIETAENMGISTFQPQDYYDDHLSLALGGLTRGVTPLEMSSAYGIYANEGVWVEPHAIKRVENRHGDTLYESNPRKKVVLEEEDNYLMLSMLRSVITDGTGWRANLGRQIAGKTGTTNNFTDSWFVGFVPELVTTVWIGEDSPRPMNYPTGRISSSQSVQLWTRIMEPILDDIPPTTFNRPQDIISLEVDPATGLLASDNPGQSVSEVFRMDNTPNERSPLQGKINSVRLDRRSFRLATEQTPADQIISVDYLVDSGIVLGPLEINFGQSSHPGRGRQPISGTYEARPGMPVLEIDPNTGIPETTEAGDYKYLRITGRTADGGRPLDIPELGDQVPEDITPAPESVLEFLERGEEETDPDDWPAPEVVDDIPEDSAEDREEDDPQDTVDPEERESARQDRRDRIDSLLQLLSPEEAEELEEELDEEELEEELEDLQDEEDNN